LEAAQIASCHPTPSAKGAYADRLPHVVLSRRTLPWERSGPGNIPWLALLLVAEGEGELVTGKLRTLLPAGLVTTLNAAEAITDDPEISVLKIKQADVLRGLLPTPTEVSLLTHVRQVNMQDSALAGTDDDGWFAVVTANRLPLATTEGKPYLACLVSVENRADIWNVATGQTPPPLVVLYAWNFTSADTGGTFESLAKQLNVQAFGASALAPVGPDGTLPFGRVDRQGQSSQANYRGPLLGTSLSPMADGSDGVDVSRAAASELGRLLGSADARFLREVVGWHRTSEANARANIVATILDEIVTPVAPHRITKAKTIANAQPSGKPDVAKLLSASIADSLLKHIPQANLGQIAKTVKEKRR
jgi:hypothetical protein